MLGCQPDRFRQAGSLAAESAKLADILFEHDYDHEHEHDFG
jgi:hypothetical protein